MIEGVAAWLDCTVESVHDGGDHHIVVGGVRDLDAVDGSRPLHFHRGGYTAPVVSVAPAGYPRWVPRGEWL